jgi:hypothetical protein
MRTMTKATGPAATDPGILVAVSSTLSAIPVDKRRRLAATVGLFAVLFVAVGVVATTGSSPGVVRVFSAVSLGVAAVLALAAWGIAYSVKVDLAEQRLDAAIAASVGELGRDEISCGCGHEHDPDELHVVDAGCEHDGRGVGCTHSCDTCVLATLRPSPTTSRSARLPK